MYKESAQQVNFKSNVGTLASDGAEGDVSQEHGLWTTFSKASTTEVFCQTWLALQCRMIGNVGGGTVFLGHPGRGPFRPVATWPKGRRNLKHLTKTAQRTLAEHRGVVSRGELREGQTHDGHYEIGYPIKVSGAVYGTTVLEVTHQSDGALQGMMRQLQWGTAWLELWCLRDALALEKDRRERIQATLDLVAMSVGHHDFYMSAMALVNDLATKLSCDRVSIGFLKRGRARVMAVSHSAEFKEETNLIQGIADAMDEAIDQREIIVYPPPAEESSIVMQAHAQFVKEYGGGALLSVPLEAEGQIVGTLLLERAAERPFDQKSVDLCRSVASLIGPILEAHRREDRWLGTKLWYSLAQFLQHLFGPSHVALKLTTAIVGVLLAMCLFAKSDYRVSAKTVLEPIVQRAAAAPFDGYIREAPARAGDLVRANGLLCTLDDRELKLERLKSLSKLEEYRKEYHRAMAEREAAKVEILTAQMDQVQSEIALFDDQLAHTRVLSPFDGIVVSGDLSQSLGSPVEKGKVLFEIAPLDRYRVVLEVDERDIADVLVGQRGHLLLSAFPSEPIGITVEKVTPVSTARDGRNFFRVEANLDHLHDRLQPAMEGAGKIEIDRRLLVWIWTHQVVDWFRLAAWSWLP
jgi:multidrug resistance efflux pump